ncbi:alpha/beta hydrolase [Nocardia jiangxiensis]|uniref:Alpha/beta hydrolase n=1 Tax=Nocardia jiangxiensis TaxID=282685 RepID=A0ABW6SGA3_9NOCA
MLYPLSFEVRDGVADTELSQAAWVFVPPPGIEPTGTMVCLSGGGFDKHYWHLEVPGHPGYSFAEHLSELGWVVIALDHLGVGESSDPPGGAVTAERLRNGNSVAAAQIIERVRAGTLVDGLGPVKGPFIGAGHSLGAFVTILVQAGFRTYDAVCLLGAGLDYSNPFGEIQGNTLAERMDASEAIGRKRFGVAPEIQFHRRPRKNIQHLLYGSDVPVAVLEADEAVSSRVPVRAAAEVIAPGFGRDEAAVLDVPVFLGFGEGFFELTRDPRAEPSFYRASPDVTLFVLQGAAHCHNTASTRVQLWDRISSWGNAVAHSLG